MSSSIKQSMPMWQRNVISSAIALAFSNVIMVAPAQAIACAVSETISTAVSTQTPCDDTQLTVTSTGTVTGTDAGVRYSGNLGAAGSLNNQGVIQASGSDFSGRLIGRGVHIVNELLGTLTNSGTITADVTTSGSSSVQAYGIEESISMFGPAMSGTLINSGTINAIANADQDAEAYGISLGDGGTLAGALTGTFSNTGVINARATSVNRSATAYGVVIGGNLSGAFSNSGTINAISTSSNNSAYANGVVVGGNLSGSFINSGTINASATALGNSSATAYGIRIGGTLGGTLSNSGTISASAVSASSSPDVYGVYIGGGIASSGVLTNSGTISADVRYTAANSSAATARAMYIGSLDGTLTNTGIINATATAIGGGSSRALAYGVIIGGLNGTLNNSGLISATASGAPFKTELAIQASYGSGVINNLAGGLIRGNIQTGGSIAVNNAGTIVLPSGDGGEGGGGSSSFIQGNYTQQTGGVLELAAINANPSSGYGRITVNGTADFSASNALAVNLDPAHTVVAGDTLPSVIAANTLTAPGGFVVTDNSALLNFTANVRASEGSFVDLVALTNTSYCGLIVSTPVTGPCEVAFDSPTLTVTNSGSITGASSGINVLTGSSTSITNRGTVIGTDYGIRFMRNAVLTGSIINSGTISGGLYSIFADNTITNRSSLASIDIEGNSARLVGAVQAPTAALNITSGANFTSEGRFNVNAVNIADTGVFNLANDVTVQSTSASAFNNAGKLAVAAGKTATVTGNYTQAASGTFQTGVASNTSYGKLVVTGAALLPAAAKINVDVVGSPALSNGTVLRSVISAGSLTASTFAVTDNSTLFDFTATQNGNAVDLSIKGSQISALESVNAQNNPAGQGAAAVIDSLIAQNPSGPVASLFQPLTTQKQVSDAVTNTLPLVMGAMARVNLGNLDSTNRVIQSRQDTNRGLSSGDEFFTDRNVWIKPIGSWANQGDLNNVSGYKAKSFGLIIGADANVSNSMNLGLAVAYANSNVRGTDSVVEHTAKVNSYRVIGYGDYKLDDRTNLKFQGDFGVGDTDGRRRINFGTVNTTASSNYDNWSAHAGVSLSRDFALSPVTVLVPSIRADYTYFHDDGYTENGAGALNLNVSSTKLEEFVLFADAKVNHALAPKTILTANLGAGYDTMAKQNSIRSAFVGGGAQFATYGLDVAPWIVRGGLGLAMNTSNAMEVTVRYDVEARESFTNQTASVKFKMPF